MTDQLTILAGVVIPLIRLTRGDDVGELIAVGVLFVVVAGVLLRLATAPYFLWKEDQGSIKELKEALARPEQIERQRIATHIGEIRAALVTELAMLSEQARRWEQRGRGRPVVLTTNPAKELMAQISYEVALVGECERFIDLAQRLAEARDNKNSDAERQLSEDMNMLSRSLFARLHRLPNAEVGNADSGQALEHKGSAELPAR